MEMEKPTEECDKSKADKCDTFDKKTQDETKSNLLNNCVDESLSIQFNKRRSYKNVAVLGLVFVFIFAAFNALHSLQSSLNSNLGFFSLCTIYIMFGFSSLMVAPYLVDKWGCKITLVGSTSGYLLYTAANFYPRWWTLIPASVVLGLCAAPLWTAQATYVTTTAINHAAVTNQKQDVVVRKLFALFHAVFQCSTIVGNVISSTVLHRDGAKSTNGTFFCGARFCPYYKSSISQVKSHTKQSTLIILMSVYLSFGFTAVFICTLLLDKIKSQSNRKKTQGPFRTFVSVFSFLKNWKIICMLPTSMFMGIFLTFVSTNYTKAFITCTVGVSHVGFVMISFGVSSILTSIVVSLVSKWVPRKFMIFLSAIMQTSLIIWFLNWNITKADYVKLHVGMASWAFSYVILDTQVTAFYGILFPTSQEIVFSIHKLFQAVGFAAALAYGGYLCITTKLYILLAFLVFAMALYTVVEVKVGRQKGDDTEDMKLPEVEEKLTGSCKEDS